MTSSIKFGLVRLFVVGSLTVIAACAGSGDENAGVTAGPTGLSGRAIAHPADPACIGNQSCDQPLHATFNVEQNGNRVAQFSTDADGQFSVALPPGSYVIVPDSGAPLADASTQTRAVTVGPTGMRQLMLTFDGLIR